MVTMDARIAELKRKEPLGYWGERITTQIEFALKLSKLQGRKHDELIDSVLRFMEERVAHDTLITRDTAEKAEDMLKSLSAEAKKYHMICVSHAHIDMNWMWGWDETVSVTLDTFRTMLDLMNDYPDFTFSQSQASVYRIVEEFDPAMLGEIKARVKEGRWEVTASTWVETDKNMPNGESLARHILYTKRYMSQLLDIDPKSLNLDYEPDTFGHNLNVPEILSRGGVRYYYHCRGYEGHNIYRWSSPSGSSIVVYQEPLWYNATIEPSMGLYVPDFCEKYHMDTMLKVYGVGDHGGGPTRRDIERIMDMASWPVYPSLRFGTYQEYFSLVEKVVDQLPEVDQELNYIFTGCYTSQSRIKMANRKGEEALNEAEIFDAVSALCTGSKYSAEDFAKAWENILFNHFHDIIPGSGVIDTREYAMGLFQKTMAIANSRKSMALRSIASNIDTASLVPGEDIRSSISEGAGVGFGSKDFRITQVDRGRGKNRIFHIFNPSPYEREEAVEITVWDWNWDTRRMVFKDAEGNIVEHQLLDKGFNRYWGHSFLRVLIKAKVPAGGYNTYIMTEEEEYELNSFLPRHPRTEKPDEFILENEHIKAVFHPQTGSLISLLDKTSGEEFMDGERTAGVFRYIMEDSSSGSGGNAWVVGRYMDVKNLTSDVKLNNIRYSGSDIRQSVSMEMEFGKSKLKALVSLDYNSSKLNYSVECDWHEIGRQGEGVPQLNFYLPMVYRCQAYKYDIPFGVIERSAMNQDVPALSWALGVRKETNKKALMLISDSKYGFRGVDDSMALTLIRSSYRPDPYPELGIHRFNFAVCLVDDNNNRKLIDTAYDYNHPFSALSEKPRKGTLPAARSLFSLEEGNVALSAIKMPEACCCGKSSLVLRVYETEGRSTRAVFELPGKIGKASYVDINETPLDIQDGISVEGSKLSFDVMPYSVASICVCFE